MIKPNIILTMFSVVDWPDDWFYRPPGTHCFPSPWIPPVPVIRHPVHNVIWSHTLKNDVTNLNIFWKSVPTFTTHSHSNEQTHKQINSFASVKRCVSDNVLKQIGAVWIVWYARILHLYSPKTSHQTYIFHRHSELTSFTQSQTKKSRHTFKTCHTLLPL